MVEGGAAMEVLFSSLSRFSNWFSLHVSMLEVASSRMTSLDLIASLSQWRSFVCADKPA